MISFAVDWSCCSREFCRSADWKDGTVNLNHIRSGNVGAESLAGVLVQYSTRAHLYLYKIEIGADGAESFAGVPT